MDARAMARSGAVAGAVAAVAAALAGWPLMAASQTTSAFRSGIELVPLQVTVDDPAGKPVADLRADDFAVFENGVRQIVTLFVAESAPLDLMLLLDTSGSMNPRMAAAREAAIGLLHAMRPQDRAAVLAFSTHVRVMQPLTNDVVALERAIPRTATIEGTALHDAVYLALRELARARHDEAQIRRQALIVVSDGEDTMSHGASAEDVLDAARRSAVTIFTVMPASNDTSGLANLVRREAVAEAEQTLRSLARETGGRPFADVRPEDLSRTFRQIADELSRQYWLGYAPTATTMSGFRAVTVHVATHPEWRARTRRGYYADDPDQP